MLENYDEVVRDRLAFVQEQDGRVVGVLVLIAGDDRFILHNVAVHPDFQGQGLGRRLLQFAEVQARERGFASITLYTNLVMTENQELYKRIGYVETERKTESGFTRIYMSKDLAASNTEETARAPLP